MKDFFLLFTKNQSLVYKVFLYLVSTALVIYLLPKGGQFKYDFPKGKPWQDSNLYAPFSFTVKKSQQDIDKQIETIKGKIIPFFNVDPTKEKSALTDYNALFSSIYLDSLYKTETTIAQSLGKSIIATIYREGFIDEVHSYKKEQVVYLKNKNSITKSVYAKFFRRVDINKLIEKRTRATNTEELKAFYTELLNRVVVPNITLNTQLTENTFKEEVKAINPNLGIIEKGERIISKGEVVEGEKYQILESLRDKYSSTVWNQTNYYWAVLGYTILVSLVFIMLLLFLKKYRRPIYENNIMISFIFFNVVIMIFITTLVVEYNPKYVYVIPLCVLPIVLKSFFDARLGLFVHVLTLLLLGFVVSNSFEFLFLQIIAGVVTILTVSELSKRANLFISVGQITLVYIVGYFAFFIIQEGDLQRIDVAYFTYFLLCGLITLFAYPLIYIYEKLFGLVSEVSLLELSNTNSKLLKELSNKAPGTFHHSLNVANLCEAAANEIGANSMLARVGALYHDIGKIENASHFTENQLNSLNILNELPPKESAKIIIDHVIKGIEIARKNKLPDRVIDFIRTHHGTSLVYYFYKKEEELNGIADKSLFKYPGPKPFSKETAILMMADSVEAASKSLKEPTSSKIDVFVESIINKQMEQGQFINANITFKEIEIIKKVYKKKLNNMYHLRIEYPE